MAESLGTLTVGVSANVDPAQQAITRLADSLDALVQSARHRHGLGLTGHTRKIRRKTVGIGIADVQCHGNARLHTRVMSYTLPGLGSNFEPQRPNTSRMP